MTPSQLDHLRKIDAHLARLLDIASKRTPGEWELHGMSVVTDNGFRVASTDYSDGNGRPRTNDAEFIAAAAGNAEAGWRATRAAIANLLIVSQYRLDAMPVVANLGRLASSTLESILAAFPLETLTPEKS